MPSPSPARATQSLPLLYRIVLTWVEPLLAVAGAVTAFTDPGRYLHTMASAAVPFDPRTSFLYTELSGAWLVFAFNEAVVLRAVDDLAVWKLLCWGMLLSDLCYCHSCAQAMGGWAEWVQVANWTAEDWVVLLTTAPPVMVRVLVVLGIGYKQASRDGDEERKERAKMS